MLITYEELHLRLTNYLSYLRDRDIFLYNYNLILYNTGLRARELHTMNRWAVNPDKTFTCTTSKGSNPRIFTCDDLTAYFINAIQNYLNAWEYNSYDTMNLYFNRNSSCGSIKHLNKYLSLSLYRHHFCKKLHYEGYSDEYIQAKLGEKDLRNSNNYIYSELYE